MGSLIDDKASLSVLKVGEGVLNGNQDTENKLIFKGKENPFQYKRFYSLVFECEFSLHWYPFDTQDCYLDIKHSKDSLLQFIIKEFKYEGNSCIYCQASASLFSKISLNKSIGKVKNFTKKAKSLFENKSIIEKIDNYFKDIKKQNREFLIVDVVEGEVVLDMESKQIDNLK